ncbi:MAG TPA: hypothetical protein VEC57_02615 [Candidatus Limnocylindrales bacterium]|nr:hypothetical protein [Candidatus Limnocylindrales bacterium]
MSFEEFLRNARNGAFDAFGATFSWAGGATDDTGRPASLSTLLRPVEPYNRWSFLAPIIGAAGAAAMIALCGVAIAAFAVMMAALALIWFLLSEVFGYELALNPDARF